MLFEFSFRLIQTHVVPVLLDLLLSNIQLVTRSRHQSIEDRVQIELFSCMVNLFNTYLYDVILTSALNMLSKKVGKLLKIIETILRCRYLASG